jgi:hypothetical protein
MTMRRFEPRHEFRELGGISITKLLRHFLTVTGVGMKPPQFALTNPACWGGDLSRHPIARKKHLFNQQPVNWASERDWTTPLCTRFHP